MRISIGQGLQVGQGTREVYDNYFVGGRLLSNGHIYDDRVFFGLFQPIIQILGHHISTYSVARTMISKNLYFEVMNALDLIDTNLAKGGLLSVFFLEVEGKKKKMKKSWSLFKSGVAKEYDLSNFETFCQENDDLFLAKVFARLILVGNGIGYLVH